MQHSKRLVIVVGDGPSLPTGLARIARSIARQFHYLKHDRINDFDLVQIGLGELTPYGYDWPVVPAFDQQDWGARTLQRVLEVAERNGVESVGVFTIWDPARCIDITRMVGRLSTTLQIKLWGYFPVDAWGPRMGGGFGGPAAAALGEYDAIIPYTHFGRRVLAASLGGYPDDRTTPTVQDPLPHFLEDFTPDVSTGAPAELRATVPEIERWMGRTERVVGCVAANQPRKDLWTFFKTCVLMGHPRVWLHTDFLITGAWSIPQLAEDMGYAKPEHAGKVLVTGAVLSPSSEDASEDQPLSDSTLAWLYQRCAVTIAPGKGEGWGYPLMESLACRVPVVHVDYAGGAEVLKSYESGWGLVPYRDCYYEGPYSLMRPVLDPKSFAEAAEELVTFDFKDSPGNPYTALPWAPRLRRLLLLLD